MPKSVSKDILVSAVPSFVESHSKPTNQEFLFSYHIKIENSGNSTIQLLSRHWFIFDSNGEYAEVKGEGVIGLQPVIHPGQLHEYDSFCNLKTDMGMMWGSYLMKRMDDNSVFKVNIPEFHLIVPSRLN